MPFRKVICLILAIAMLWAPVAPVQAQSAPWMPEPGTQVGMSPSFAPASLKGMVMYPNDPFRFDFLIYQGDTVLSAEDKSPEYRRLIKYFLAALAIDDRNQWVNLSPYEKDRIIPDDFGLTEMGRDLLAQDYLLKQIASSLVSPDGDLGKDFWARVYSEAREKFGSAEIPAELINKVWIMPGKAVVYEKDRTVYVAENHLKVMLEADYWAIRNASAGNPLAADPAQDIPRQIMREVILPALEKEVNEGKNFAPLRQIYSGMVLAAWYKRRLKDSILGRLYADQGKVQGVRQDDPRANQKIFDDYVTALRRGVVNMVREDVDKYTQEVIPRRYFSGGTSGYVDPAMIEERTNLSAAEAGRVQAEAVRVDRVPTALERTGAVPAETVPDDHLGAAEQDRVIAKFFLKLSVRVAELGFPKAVIQKIEEAAEVRFRLRKGDEPFWRARFMAEAYLRGLPGESDILWLKPQDDPLEAAGLAFRQTLRRFFPEAKEQEIEWARQRVALRVHIMGRSWWQAFRGTPWEVSSRPSELKAQEDRPQSPPVQEAADRAQRAEILRSQWEGKLSRIVVSGDLQVDDLLTEDHPFREAVRAAVRQGHVIEFDISALARRDNRYVLAEAIFLAASGTCQRTLAPGYSAMTDVTFVLSEILTNAFVHGSKLDFTEPIFLIFTPLPDNTDVYEIKVFDVASDRPVDPQEFAMAKKSTMTGQGKGVRQIQFDWQYGRQPALVNGLIVGTVTQAYPHDDLGSTDPAQVSFEGLLERELRSVAQGYLYRDEMGRDIRAFRGILEKHGIEGSVAAKTATLFWVRLLAREQGAGEASVPEQDPQIASALEGLMERQREINERPQWPRMQAARMFKTIMADLASPAPEREIREGRPSDLGGIDMDSANLDLLIRRDGEGVVLPVDRQDLEHIRIEGLIPVILDIQPAAAMPLFSWFPEQAETKA